MIDYLGLAHELNLKGMLRGEEYRARCPLHDDSNPSFSLNTSSGVWICFSRCGSGTFIELVEQVLGCSYQEAREWVDSNGSRVTTTRLISSLHDQLFPVTLEADTNVPGWLQAYEGLTNEFMPQWFLDRGFTWRTINHWNLRYSPILDSVTIPIYWDTKIVGTVTRNKNPALPKYQNSPGLPRTEFLFGEISNSRQDIMICEGALDLLWLWQNGYNAVGLLGNELSLRQVQLLTNYRLGEVILALDNDDGGRYGKQKIISQLQKHWLPTQITEIVFPEDKKDPNDCSPELLKQLYESRKMALQFTL